MYKSIKHILRRGLTRIKTTHPGTTRRIRLTEETPSDRFVLLIALMILFFIGLVSLEIIHMVWMDSWNDVIFNGIMLVVGTIVGSIWGKTVE